MGQLLIHIDDELKTKLKLAAVQEGRTIRELVTDAIMKSLNIESTSVLAAISTVDHACKKCSKTWRGKPDPKTCPFCKSYSWREPAVIEHTHTCHACSFSWESKKAAPAICPSCRSYEWNRDSAKTLKKKFYNMYQSSKLSVQELAPCMGTTDEKLRDFIKGDKEVTQAHIDVLRNALRDHFGMSF